MLFRSGQRHGPGVAFQTAHDVAHAFQRNAVFRSHVRRGHAALQVSIHRTIHRRGLGEQRGDAVRGSSGGGEKKALLERGSCHRVSSFYFAWERRDSCSALRLRIPSAIARNCGFRNAASPASRHSRKTGCISPVGFEGASEGVGGSFPVIGDVMIL